MKAFLHLPFVIFLVLFQHESYATRYMPMIVWDHLNPMLSCKCNWFHNIVKMEIYDRIQFVCPSLKISVSLLDSYSRPLDQMNLNIFMRKWKGGLNDKEGLMREMKSGNFCDPMHSETKKLYTCLNGNEGESFTVKVQGSENYYNKELVVFFNNGKDGRVTTLSSKERKCTMALVAEVTWKVAKKYDFTYEKNLNSTLKQCDDLNQTCSEQPTKTNITTTNNTTVDNVSPTKCIGTSSRRLNATAAIGNGVPLARESKSDKNDWDKFKYGLLVGLGVMILVFIVQAVAYFTFFKKIRKRSKTDCQICQCKASNGDCNGTSINITTTANQNALPEKTTLPPISQIPAHQTTPQHNYQHQGRNNQAYENSLNRDGQENALPQKTTLPPVQGINNHGYENSLNRDSVAG